MSRDLAGGGLGERRVSAALPAGLGAAAMSVAKVVRGKAV